MFVWYCWRFVDFGFYFLFWIVMFFFGEVNGYDVLMMLFFFIIKVWLLMMNILINYKLWMSV